MQGKQEPVFVWSFPLKLALEMIHSYNIERVVHLTAGNGWLALAACMTRTPGICVCHTANHAKTIRKHTVDQMLRMKQSSEDGVYDPNLISLLESIPKNDEEDPKVKATPKKAGGNQAKTTTPLKTTPPKTRKEARGKDGRHKKKPKKGHSRKAGATKTSKKKPTNDDGSQEEESVEWMTSDGEE